ncbi:phosphoglycolate phosphatase [Paenalcaligenes suwonensis]|uniref:phosphoglycolate phosphatase n=1 Tax=Paenalcaligenes suwonensis TaxID=1202713 RepID=UPI00140AD5DA|nr:phosphoglycolate phosphatase [Paenalcaligenes suwonensis]NHC61775.1 phosphoglycolate phosphatase [Paenalcaligenes suwonensis]
MTTSKLVLFDFDGTLVDSAPDLAAAVNRLRHDRNLPPLPYELLRPVASHGARGLLGTGLGLDTEHADYPIVRQQFLDYYAEDITTLSHLFSGVETMLDGLKEHNLPWGIVTNKALGLTKPIMAKFELNHDCKVLVGGDSTPYLKPNPASLLLATSTYGIAPEHCIYVGDDLRDIQAGKAAGMPTIVAAYGYCKDDASVSEWGADAIAHSPEELLHQLQEWAHTA